MPNRRPCCWLQFDVFLQDYYAAMVLFRMDEGRFLSDVSSTVIWQQVRCCQHARMNEGSLTTRTCHVSAYFFKELVTIPVLKQDSLVIKL